MAEEKGLLGKIWYLKKINLLQGLQGAQMEELATSCTMKEFAKKETLYSPLDDQEYIYFLKRGMARLYKIDPSGKEITFALLGMGESFGSLSPGAREEGGEEFAQALEPTLVCFIPKNRLLAMIEKNPYLNLKVSKLLGLRLIEVQILLEDLAFKSVLQRVASLLLRLYKKFGKEAHSKKMIALSLSHYDLSTMIGATREATTVALDRLKNMDLIEIRRKKISLQDMDGLERIKEGF